MKEQTATQPGREAVKEYLQQYRVAKGQQRTLERRHRDLKRELEDPALGSTYRTMPTSRTPNPDKAVSVVYRIAEVEERIDEQRGTIAKAVLNIMDLIDLLPPHSMERQVVELRHIDCMEWDEIPDEVHMSRSRIFDYYNGALEIISENKRAQKLIQEYLRRKNKGGWISDPLDPQPGKDRTLSDGEP